LFNIEFTNCFDEFYLSVSDVELAEMGKKNKNDDVWAINWDEDGKKI